MGEHIAPIIFVVVTMVFFSMSLASSDLGSIYDQEELNEYGLNQSDLKLSPNLPNPEEINFDIEDDAQEYENIRFDNTEDINDTDFDTEKVASKANESEQAWILYRVPDDAKDITTKVTKWGVLESSGIEMRGYITPPEGVDDNDTEFEFNLKGENEFERTGDGNYIMFVFDSSASDAKLYGIDLLDALEKGTLATITAYLNSIASTVVALTTIATGLPPALSWLAVVFGTVLTIAAIIIVSW